MRVELPYHPYLRRGGRHLEVRVHGYLHQDGTAEALAWRMPWDQGGAEVELTEEETSELIALLREEECEAAYLASDAACWDSAAEQVD